MKGKRLIRTIRLDNILSYGILGRSVSFGAAKRLYWT